MDKLTIQEMTTIKNLCRKELQALYRERRKLDELVIESEVAETLKQSMLSSIRTDILHVEMICKKLEEE